MESGQKGNGHERAVNTWDEKHAFFNITQLTKVRALTVSASALCSDLAAPSTVYRNEAGMIRHIV